MLINYETNYPNTVVPIVVFYAAYQPYSYEQWGEQGEENIPFIISDSENIISKLINPNGGEWFTFGAYPLNIIIDQNMEIFKILEGELEPEDLESYFNQLNN